MMNFYFDKMELYDLDKIIQLETNNYPIPWTKGVMVDCIKAGYHCIVLKKPNFIIGYAFLMTTYDESHLLNMCIDKNYQGQKLGKKLLKYLENICKYNHSKTFLLEVRKSNPIAYNLYKSFGFSEIGVRKNYYRCVVGREDAIVMTKKLKYKV